MADKKKKVSVNVETQDDGGFKIELSTGLLQKQHKVAESMESLVKKITDYLRAELGNSGTAKHD